VCGCPRQTGLASGIARCFYSAAAAAATTSPAPFVQRRPPRANALLPLSLCAAGLLFCRWSKGPAPGLVPFMSRLQTPDYSDRRSAVDANHRFINTWCTTLYVPLNPQVAALHSLSYGMGNTGRRRTFAYTYIMWVSVDRWITRHCSKHSQSQRRPYGRKRNKCCISTPVLKYEVMFNRRCGNSASSS